MSLACIIYIRECVVKVCAIVLVVNERFRVDPLCHISFSILMLWGGSLGASEKKGALVEKRDYPIKR